MPSATVPPLTRADRRSDHGRNFDFAFAAREQCAAEPARRVLFGVVAGFTEGTANAAAPPLIIYYLALGLSPGALVQALNICFFAGKTAQFTMLASSGSVSMVQWLITLPFAAVATVGVLYGIGIRNRVSVVTYRRWLKLMLFAVALLLLAQVIYSRWVV